MRTVIAVLSIAMSGCGVRAVKVDGGDLKELRPAIAVEAASIVISGRDLTVTVRGKALLSGPEHDELLRGAHWTTRQPSVDEKESVFSAEAASTVVTLTSRRVNSGTISRALVLDVNKDDGVGSAALELSASLGGSQLQSVIAAADYEDIGLVRNLRFLSIRKPSEVLAELSAVPGLRRFSDSAVYTETAGWRVVVFCEPFSEPPTAGSEPHLSETTIVIVSRKEIGKT